MDVLRCLMEPWMERRQGGYDSTGGISLLVAGGQSHFIVVHYLGAEQGKVKSKADHDFQDIKTTHRKITKENSDHYELQILIEN